MQARTAQDDGVFKVQSENQYMMHQLAIYNKYDTNDTSADITASLNISVKGEFEYIF